MEVLTDAAGVLVALAAVATSVGVLSRLRPVRWLWRQLVARPLGTWFRGEVRSEVTEVVDERLVPIMAELHPNGGASLRDRVDYIVDEHGRRLAECEETLVEIRDRGAA